MPISKALLNRAVTIAFNQTKEVQIAVTYHSVVVTGNDVVTDAIIDTDVPYGPIKVLNVKLTDLEVDYFPAGLITQKLLIKPRDLPVVPSESDWVDINGARWEVRRVKRVPGDAVWQVYVQLT